MLFHYIPIIPIIINDDAPMNVAETVPCSTTYDRDTSTMPPMKMMTTDGADDIVLATSGWWFGTCFIFPHIGNNHPN